MATGRGEAWEVRARCYSLSNPVVTRTPEIKSIKAVMSMADMAPSVVLPPKNVECKRPQTSSPTKVMDKTFASWLSTVGGQPMCPAPPEYRIRSVNVGCISAVPTYVAIIIHSGTADLWLGKLALLSSP